jgi:Fur family ferric uptake transcriptional regulator
MTDNDERSLLRREGLRATGSRIAVLRALRLAHGPLTHGELQEALADLDRVTLYRNLNCLVEAGLARQILAGGVSRFEVRLGPEAANHPHFVCDDCGVVVCLSDEVSLPALPTGDAWQRSVARASVQLQGQCPDCLDLPGGERLL